MQLSWGKLTHEIRYTPPAQPPHSDDRGGVNATLWGKLTHEIRYTHPKEETADLAAIFLGR